MLIMEVVIKKLNTFVYATLGMGFNLIKQSRLCHNELNDLKTPFLNTSVEACIQLLNLHHV